MLIGELSCLTGVSKDTIRFYEKKGLIKITKTHRLANNYKDYPAETVNLLLFIKRAKSFGFKLDEIREWLEDWKGGKVPIAQKIQVFEAQVENIQAKIEEFIALKKTLEAKLNEYKQLQSNQ